MYSSGNKPSLYTVFHDMMLEDLKEMANKPGDLVRVYTMFRNLPLNWEEDDGQGYWYIETELLQLNALQSVGQYDVVREGSSCYYLVFSRNTELDPKYGKMLVDRYLKDHELRLYSLQLEEKKLRDKVNNYGYLIWEHAFGGEFTLGLKYDKVPPHEQLELPLVFE